MRTSFATPPLWCPGRFQYDLAKVKGAKGDPAQTSPGPRADRAQTRPRKPPTPPPPPRPPPPPHQPPTG